MTWRDHTWEFVISAFSWFVALAALVFVVIFFACETLKTRRVRRRSSRRARP